MLSCKFFLNKIRNELAQEIDDADTDKAALFYAKNINDLTRILTSLDEFLEIIHHYTRPDLVNILSQRSIWEDTIWYKNINKTNNGYEIYDICLDNINILKLQACDTLNNDFGLDLAFKERTLDGTLNADCLNN